MEQHVQIVQKLITAKKIMRCCVFDYFISMLKIYNVVRNLEPLQWTKAYWKIFSQQKKACMILVFMTTSKPISKDFEQKL